MFFASSALYPLWRMKESSLTLYYICAWNPFSHADRTGPLRADGQVNWQALGVTLAYCFVFLAAAIYGMTVARHHRAARRPAGLMVRATESGKDDASSWSPESSFTRLVRAAGRIALTFLVAALGVVGARSAPAANGQDPDWPCLQRKVSEISPAQVWTGPSLDAVDDSWVCANSSWRAISSSVPPCAGSRSNRASLRSVGESVLPARIAVDRMMNAASGETPQTAM